MKPANHCTSVIGIWRGFSPDSGFQANAKIREMSHISKWKDFQWGLWVFNVTYMYHFKAATENIHNQLYDLGFVISMFSS